MNCEDLMTIKEMRKGMRLIAGEAGVQRNIRWIYFADCMQCLEGSVGISELIHGEELVVVTNVSITDNDELLLSMIDEMYKKDVAALVINEGQISPKIRQRCDELQLPLYELSVQLHLIDFSQIICRVLVEEEGNQASRERVLSSILYSDNLNVEDIMEQASFLGVNLSGKYRAAVVVWNNENKESEMTDGAHEGKNINRRKRIKKWFINEFQAYGLKNVMTHSRADAFVIMFPADFFSRDLLVSILSNVMKQIKRCFGITVSVGIGTPYEYIKEFRLSYQEAKNALKISKMVMQDTHIYFYDDLDLYSFIAQVTNGKFLDDYVHHKLGRLLDADGMQEGNLAETLEAYLNHNCNANATAEALFIHRNTMRYRLDKIRHILNADLNDLSDCLELKLAFAIWQYRRKRQI